MYRRIAQQWVNGFFLLVAFSNSMVLMAKTTDNHPNGEMVVSSRAGDKISQVEKSLVADINKARNALSATQKTIAKERAGFSSTINSLEKEVNQLRERAELVRREADESALSLSTLEQRLSTWQQQQDYQQSLVFRFLKQHNILKPENFRSSSDSNASALPALTDQMQSIGNYFSDIKHDIMPTWKMRPVILPSGDVEPMLTLLSGPVSWFWDKKAERSGLLEQANHELKVAYTFDTSASNNLGLLAETGEGLVTFDPSLGRALASAQTSETTVEHIQKGGMWAIPILLFALFAVSIAIFKAIQLWKLPAVIPYTEHQLLSLHSKAKHVTGLQSETRFITRNKSGMQNRLISVFAATDKGQQRDDQLFNQLVKDKHSLDTGIGAIAVTASVAPLLGLLGTVSGMIETFKMMTLFGSGDPEIVSGGIAQALVTTELGLVVAIPALIMNALLSRKAKHYYSQLESFSIQLSQLPDVEEMQYEAAA